MAELDIVDLSAGQVPAAEIPWTARDEAEWEIRRALEQRLTDAEGKLRRIKDAIGSAGSAEWPHAVIKADRIRAILDEVPAGGGL